MFELVRHFQDLAAATLTAACVTGSVSTAEAEANAIVSGFSSTDFQAVNDHTYIGATLEGRKAYHDHDTIAKAIVNNAFAEDLDVTGVVDKSAATCPASAAS